MTTKRNKAAIGAVFCLALAVTACTGENGAESEGSRQTIQKPDKTITVVETPEPKAGPIEVANIKNVEGMGQGFLNEDAVIVMRQNPDVKPIQVEGTTQPPNNLYAYDLQSNTAEALKPDSENQNFAVLSPDGKHLFYKVNYEEDAHGFILNLETKRAVPTGDSLIDYADAQWLDNSTVMFRTMEGKLVTSDLEGKTKVLFEGPKEGRIVSAAKTAEGLYYVANEKLYFLPDGAAEPSLVAESAESVVPSPDGKQLAVVKKATETTRTLFITDTKGNELLKLGTATQVFGVSWSADSAKIVYNLMSEDGGDGGIIVADAVTGETTGLSVDVQNAASTLRWSPSGKKILVTTFKEQGFVSYVITLK
jgi:TolB protein